MTHFRVAIALLVATMLGCESRPHNPAAALAGASAQNVMVLPLNVAVTLPSELEGSSDRVWNELSRYIRAHGKHVETVRFGDARRIWLDAVQQIQSGERAARADFDGAARLIVLELGQHSEFDAVIMPSIFIQQARLQGKSGSWDRVKRKVEIEGDVRSPRLHPSPRGRARGRPGCARGGTSHADGAGTRPGATAPRRRPRVGAFAAVVAHAAADRRSGSRGRAVDDADTGLARRASRLGVRPGALARRSDRSAAPRPELIPQGATEPRTEEEASRRLAVPAGRLCRPITGLTPET